jgi:hypothetical protein
VIFEPLDALHRWRPSALAAGPSAGLQGGAVASLLTAEVEALATAKNWGTAVSVTAWLTPRCRPPRRPRRRRRRPRRQRRRCRSSRLREVRDDAASRTASAMGLSRQSLPGAAPLKPIPLNPQRDRTGPPKRGKPTAPKLFRPRNLLTGKPRESPPAFRARRLSPRPLRVHRESGFSLFFSNSVTSASGVKRRHRPASGLRLPYPQERTSAMADQMSALCR